jgi:hypothetical protein
MTTPNQNPPPRTLQPAEERKIQVFLERAAPIVLEDPNLTSARWQKLAALANELDLSAQQFRSTMDDLLNRGVIKRTDAVPPCPPPLPGRPAGASTSRPENVAEDFALSAPGAPPPVPPLPQPPVGPPPRSQPLPEPSGTHPPESEKVRPVTGVPPVVADQPSVNAHDQFRQRAGAILAEHRGLNAKSQALLASAAKELGVGDAEAQEALESLQSPRPTEPAESAAARAVEKSGSTRWRVEGAPVPIPPPPPKSPAETFLDFARPSLAAVRDGVVGADLERRILLHGTRVLGLSPVYARHLLLDLLAERKLQLASLAEVPPPAAAPDSGPVADPKLDGFLVAARPVLAQHRGVNAQSRVLLTALAREQGLTEQEMDQAIGFLSSRPAEETIDRGQQERLAPFRDQVEASLKKASRSILTPAMYDKLVAAGCDLFGVERERVIATVKEYSEQHGLAVITHEQAEQHLVELLQDVLPAGAKLTATQRERIELEGAQWGLPATRVAVLIDESCRRSEQLARKEEQVNQWALTLAVGAVIVLSLFLLWAVIISAGRDTPKAAVKESDDRPTQPVPERKRERQPSWVDDHSDLAIAVINARSDLPRLRKELTDLASNNAAHRETAYSALVDYLFGQASDEFQRDSLAEMLAYCVACDPAETSTDQLLKSLLREIPSQSGEVPWTSEAIPRMYLGVRTVATSLARATGQAERVSKIVAALHRAAGVTPDPSLPVAELRNLCLRSLSERLFLSLLGMAATAPAQNLPLQSALAAQATKYLDVAQLDKFNADFLAALLTAEPNLVSQCDDLLRITIASKNPLAVLRLLELYESTTNSELRESLQVQLLLRTPGTPPGNSVEEIAAFVRQSLGVTDSHDPEGVWAKLMREAQDAISRSNAPPEPSTPLLAEVLRLAHYETLACAFVQDDWSSAAVAELRKAGPRAPDSGLKGDAAEVREDVDSGAPAPLDRTTQTQLRSYIAALTARRALPNERLGALANLQDLAIRVPDVPPEFATSIAAYILENKSSVENERSLERLPDLARWNQLILALADRVEECALTDQQLQALLRSLSSAVTLPPGKEGRSAARNELLRLALQRLQDIDSPASPPLTVPENAAALLADIYAQQAQLLDVPIPATVAQPRNPYSTLRALVDGFSSRLAGATLPDAQRATMNQVPHLLLARDYAAGGNEVQRLVALERTWLQLLAVEAARRNPARAADAEALVTELQKKDRQASHVLAQLRDGHQATLQMWMLIGKRG